MKKCPAESTASASTGGTNGMHYEVSLSRIKDLPAMRRPREWIIHHGIQNATDEMLLAILLRAGTRGQSVIDLARHLIDCHARSLENLSTASHADLCAIKGIGPAKALELQAAFELGRRAGPTTPRLPRILTPLDALAVLADETKQMEQEVFWVLLLDLKYRLKQKPIAITKGILNASLVHPREVFRDAIRSSAAAVLVAHNHPSGDPKPSPEDLKITKQLVAAGEIIGIDVIDHIIIGGHRPHPAPYTSLKEQGLMD